MESTQKPRYGSRCLGWFLFALSIWIAVQCLKTSANQEQGGYTYLGVYLSQAEFKSSLDLVNLLSISVAGPMILVNTVGLIGQDIKKKYQKLNS